MSNSRIEKLRQQVREMGHNLAIIEKRGLRGKDHVAKKIAHNLLLDQLYELEKRVWVDVGLFGSNPVESQRLTETTLARVPELIDR